MAAEAELEREGGYYDEDGLFYPDEPPPQQQQQKNKQQVESQQSKGESDLKAAEEAAKVAAEAAKNLFGGVTSLGGSLLGKAASSMNKPQQQQQQQQVQQQQKQQQLARTSSVKSEVKGVDSDGDEVKGEKRKVTFGPEIAEEEATLERRDHRPKFVKHINKTRTMSGKQKWEWAFDRIIQVNNFYSFSPYFFLVNPKMLKVVNVSFNVIFTFNLLFYCLYSKIIFYFKRNFRK